jgi:hypothetical protein
MAYNEKLAERIRKAIAHLPNIEEKKMFRGVTFIVNDKMCVSVSGDEMMCRFDPVLYETFVEKNGFRTMIMKDGEYKGARFFVGIFCNSILVFQVMAMDTIAEYKKRKKQHL